jgi:type I restriction enzyme S subunit
MIRPRHQLVPLWPVPPNWEWTSVSDIAGVGLGRQRSPKNHTGKNMRPYVRAGNITWNGWDLADVKEMNFDDADFERFRLSPGDVLVNEGSGSANEVGKPAIWQGQIENCCFQNTLIRVKPEGCTSEYIHSYFLLSALTENFVSKTQGVNIHHIGKEGLASFPVPVCPLSEQRRIVTKIDSLSAKSRRGREHLNHIPGLVEKYKQAILATAFRGELTRDWRNRTGRPFDWESTTLGQQLVDIRYGTAKKCDYAGGAVGVLRIPNVQLGKIQIDDLKSADFTSDELRKLRLEKGDILIIRSNELVVQR